MYGAFESRIIMNQAKIVGIKKKINTEDRELHILKRSDCFPVSDQIIHNNLTINQHLDMPAHLQYKTRAEKQAANRAKSKRHYDKYVIFSQPVNSSLLQPIILGIRRVFLLHDANGSQNN